MGTLSQVDAMLRVATTAGEVPGVVALAATDKGIVYEGIYGRRRIDGGPAMARDTVFRVASESSCRLSRGTLGQAGRDKELDQLSFSHGVAVAL